MTQEFAINDRIKIYAETYQTRYSWGHKAYLYVDGQEVSYSKYTYYNRTWERYTFESVIRGVVSKTPDRLLSKADKKLCYAFIDNYQERSSFLKTIAMVARMGDVLTTTPEARNDWKERMLKAGLKDNIDMPEDWETLTEEEKETRLNKALVALR